MSTEKAFAFKIALFNTIGFSATAGLTTYLDAGLSSHVVYAARQYPLGYWICLLGFPIFAATYYYLPRARDLRTRVFLPAGILLFVGAVSLLNFLPEFPHGNISTWILLYSCVSAVSCWIRASKVGGNFVQSSEVDPSIKIERIKEAVTIWRTIALFITFGYIGLLFPWTNFIWDYADRTLTTPRDVQLLGAFSTVQLGLFSAYVLAGLTYEAFRKAIQTADLMLEVK